MAVRLMESLATTAPLAELFSDESILRAMLDFEAALARVEGRLGVIPRSAASTISNVARATELDEAAIANISNEARRSGTPAIPFVRTFTKCVREQNKAAAGFVHWGATSQDLCDTALVLLLQKSQSILESDLRRLERALQRLSQQHRGTVMLGRTLLQAAPPVTFGLKAAGWFGAVSRGHQRLNAAFDGCLMLQFGGACGTLAALGKDGPRIAQALASELKLRCPEAPWHTHRDRLASFICACGVLTGSLGKMARDILLLSQNEVAEVAEPGGDGHGGSSTMPHKRNPVGSVLALAAAQRVPALVSSFLSAMVQEHERAAGGWQAEWPIVSSIVQSTGLAIACMAEVAEGLTVDKERMRANIEATRGIIFAERASLLLGKKIGRDRAHKLIEQASSKSAVSGLRLSDALAEMPEIAQHLMAAELRDLDNPAHYLGAAEDFRKALLSSSRPANPASGRQSRRKSAGKKKR
ncbi:MAG TPA: 3-carboxy-cis,cis-muconate cycloisomerase [Candidatus Angelobacter sp.]|nr:3-carboxy-cis,cis-muconate cycloisomerase [Candidatus Angelobacter sp.]